MGSRCFTLSEIQIFLISKANGNTSSTRVSKPISKYSSEDRVLYLHHCGDSPIPTLSVQQYFLLQPDNIVSSNLSTLLQSPSHGTGKPSSGSPRCLMTERRSKPRSSSCCLCSSRDRNPFIVGRRDRSDMEGLELQKN